MLFQKIIEEILSIPMLLEFLFLVAISTYFTILHLLKKFKVIKESTFTLSTIAILLISTVSIIILSNVSTEFVTDNEWKTIYTNDQQATITLKNYDNYRYLDLSMPYDITAGKELSEYYKVFIRDRDWQGYIMAEKEGDTVTRAVSLKPENIISSSKITE